jgi:hypothetical protein
LSVWQLSQRVRLRLQAGEFLRFYRCHVCVCL